MVALAQITIIVTQKICYRGALDPFGLHQQMQVKAQSNNRLDNGYILAIIQQIPDKALINFQLVYWQRTQPAQGRIANTEVIQRQSHAKTTQLAKQEISLFLIL